MKRKLSAIIALVLAVVMVFPTAVFAVEGETETEAISIEKFDISITGMDGKKVEGKSVSIPVDGTVTITVDTDADKVEFLLSDSAIATSKTSGNSITYTGRYAGNSGTVTITATKNDADGNVAATKTDTLSLSCKTPEIAVDSNGNQMITVSYEGGNGDDSIDPGKIVSNGKVSFTLDNGKSYTVDAKVNTVDIFSSKTETYATVKVKGGESYLYFNYEATTPYGTYTGTVSKKIYVLGKAIDEITIESAPNETFLPDAEGVAKNELVVKAIYTDSSTDVLNDYTLHGIYNAKTLDEAVKKAQNGDPNATSFEDYLVGEEIFIVVSYDGKYAGIAADDILDFSNPIPTNIEILPQSNAKDEYISGQTLGEFGWNGIVIKVSYADGVESKYYYNDNGGTYDSKKCAGISEMKGVLELKPFVYGDDEIKVTYEENGTKLTRYIDVSFFTIEKKTVEKLEIANSKNVKVSYSDGEKLNLDNLTLNVYYNSGEVEEISYANPNVTCSPNHNTALTTDNDSVLIVYTYVDEETEKEYSVKTSLNIKVATPKTTLKDIQLLSSSGAKKDYFIGEAFDASGFELLFIFSDASTQIKDLSDFTLSVDSSVFSKGAFTKAMNGTLTVNFTAYSTKITLNIPGISVTKRPTLTEISATTTKMDFLEGEAPKAKDFVVTAKYDDNSTRVFTIDSDDTYAEKSTAYVTKDGVQYTLKLTPVSIEEGTDSIRVTYTEKITATGVSTTKYTDVDIDVTVPEAILTYYDVTAKSYVITPYEDFYDALEAAEEAADSLTSYYASRVPEIELRKDVVMTADFPTRESMEIDLNGHSLTMIRGELYVASNAGTAVEVVFQNSDKADAKLIYSSDAEEAIIIAYNESYTIDRDSSSDGKYEVKISSVKNGKVTGPEEVTHGHDAKFTITPNEDYEIATIKVNNKSVSIPENGELVIEDVQEALTVTVTFQEKAWDNPFTDIYKSATYYKSIQFVYENGLFTGTSATEFEPDTTMTRAMFVTVLGRMAGVNVDRYQTSSFTDVPTGQWYSEYVQWASSIGLVEGYGDGTFGPNDAITHAQMYVLMQRYAALVERMNTNANGATIAANDTRDIPDWAYDAVEYAAKNQFLVTSSYRLTPNANAKRSELATLLEKFCTNVLDWAD